MTDSNSKEISKLIIGLQKQDRKSQEAVYKRYFGLMMSMSMRYCENWDDAKDIVNTSFFKIFTKIENYQGKGSFEGWMKRTLINTALDFLKSKKYEKVNMDNIDSYDENVFVENDADWNINSEDILLLIQALPDATRTVFNLYIMEGFKHKEISEMLGISEGTSHWHVLNARRILQEKLKDLI